MALSANIRKKERKKQLGIRHRFFTLLLENVKNKKIPDDMTISNISLRMCPGNRVAWDFFRTCIAKGKEWCFWLTHQQHLRKSISFHYTEETLRKSLYSLHPAIADVRIHSIMCPDPPKRLSWKQSATPAPISLMCLDFLKENVLLKKTFVCL